jgi:colanic acid biosynthesis protein WcaH
LLSDQDFLGLINVAPLIAIDLIVRKASGEVLLGKRKNKPAQGFWFVPGGRVLKNERLTDVFRRLCLNELALDVDFSEAKLLGAYEHFYQDNFLDSSDISTHYVVMGYELSLQCADQVSLDQQHSEQQWWPVEALLVSDEVHSNTKAYFDEAYR